MEVERERLQRTEIMPWSFCMERPVEAAKRRTAGTE